MQFSKNEQKLLQDEKYFLFSELDGNMARVVSRCTLDSWIIKLKDTYCILYHEHPGQKRYHEHRRFQKTADAIAEIKSHDQYSQSKK